MIKEHGIYSSGRLIGYSDAIFSIAITLLILDIKIPEGSAIGDNNLILLLFENWPKFLSFLISFLIISVIWFNHHTMFHYIKNVNHTLMFINTILMLNVIIIPFCASLLGEYAAQGNKNSITAAMIYGFWITIGGIPFNLIWSYSLKHNNILYEGYPLNELYKIKKHFIRGPFLYLTCTLLSLVSVWVSILGFVLLIILYFVPATWWIAKRKELNN